jgi:hypothetical protein
MPTFASWQCVLTTIETQDAACQVVPTFSGYSLGLFFIFLQCVVWIMAAIITQFLFSGDGEAAMDSAFLMSYFGMSLLSFYLPIKILWERAARDHTALLQTPSSDSLYAELHTALGYRDFFTIFANRTQKLMTETTVIWNHKKHMLAALQ